jgi:hypothetical protein
MALRKFPHPEEAAHGSALRAARGQLHGRLEGRAMLIRPIVDFLTASFAG